MEIPNPEVEFNVDAVDTVNEQSSKDLGTEQKDTVENPTKEAEPEVDYTVKFKESQKEALRLLEENKAKDAEIERLRILSEQGEQNSLYPGYEDLDPEARANLVAYTESIKKSVKEDLYKDPSISYAKQSHNEKRWNDAFQSVLKQRPELKESEQEFRNKYFNPKNEVPDNIEDILGDVSKIFLFDKAKEIGAAEERQKADRIDIERSVGSDKTQSTSRTLEDWQRIAASNPAKFAKMAKEYDEDLKSGKLQ